ADAEAWERLWARSQLVLHTTGQALSCSLLSPCDLSAELVPCWQPVPAGPCQALPGLQQPAVGQEPQEFGGLQPHPNLCIQVGPISSPLCPLYPLGTSPGALPGHRDDLLLLEHGGNTSASLCALEQGACTLLSSFTSTVRGRDLHVPAAVASVAQTAHPLPLLQAAGRPGLLQQELQRDVAEGQCRQIWRSENSTSIVLWACPLHKYLRTRWALAWMGVLLGAASLLLLFLLKKEDVKGEQHPSEGCAWPGT
ncbi:I17RC protein, partial [Psilopogon haemacephalus]|nr:I17RC protein [Psilopogon haemacephalus]